VICYPRVTELVFFKPPLKLVYIPFNNNSVGKEYTIEKPFVAVEKYRQYCKELKKKKKDRDQTIVALFADDWIEDLLQEEENLFFRELEQLEEEDLEW
jgi:hypothetical protein